MSAIIVADDILQAKGVPKEMHNEICWLRPNVKVKEVRRDIYYIALEFNLDCEQDDDGEDLDVARWWL